MNIYGLIRFPSLIKRIENGFNYLKATKTELKFLYIWLCDIEINNTIYLSHR